MCTVWRIPILEEEACRVQAEAVCRGSLLRALSLSLLTFQLSVLNTHKAAAGMTVNGKRQLLAFCFPHQPLNTYLGDRDMGQVQEAIHYSESSHQGILITNNSCALDITQD